ncbi:hypothetical protein WEH80_06040 [Actinomycetes bacterium KLBMP 9759]
MSFTYEPDHAFRDLRGFPFRVLKDKQVGVVRIESPIIPAYCQHRLAVMATLILTDFIGDAKRVEAAQCLLYLTPTLLKITPQQIQRDVRILILIPGGTTLTQNMKDQPTLIGCHTLQLFDERVGNPRTGSPFCR